MCNYYLKMIANTHIHKVAQELGFDSDSFNIPIDIRFLVDTLNGPVSKDLERLLRPAFQSRGVTLTGDSVLDNAFYQAGSTSFVFIVDSGKPLVMQIARDGCASRPAQVVRDDFRNLRFLESIDQVGYFPDALGELGTIQIGGFTNVPVLFTELFEGYHELRRNANAFGQEETFFTNMPPSDRIDFLPRQSRAIVEKIVEPLAYVYMRTYDPQTNLGKMVMGYKINAGDFVYRSHGDESQPLVKVVTARKIDEGSPHDLLLNLSSAQRIYYDLVYKWDYSFLFAGGGDDYMAPIFDGVRNVFGDGEALHEWKRTLKAELRDRTMDIFDRAETGHIQSWDDVSPGYRSMIRAHATVGYLNFGHGNNTGFATEEDLRGSFMMFEDPKFRAYMESDLIPWEEKRFE